MQEGILDQVAQFVEVAVNFSLDLAIFLGRYLRLHALLLSLGQNGVGVVTAIGQQVLGGDAFDQFLGLGAIRRGTRCNKDSDRHTMRIHGQMYFGVEPPFV